MPRNTEEYGYSYREAEAPSLDEAAQGINSYRENPDGFSNEETAATFNTAAEYLYSIGEDEIADKAYAAGEAFAQLDDPHYEGRDMPGLDHVKNVIDYFQSEGSRR